ncbi:MAG: ATP-binding protein, partial [Planctomycetaceae bacterium]
MFDYEKLGQFYLGREYDLEARQPTAQKLLYDAKDLTTHAVCVGMTGSGKTGLCLALLEEAAIDNIPAIVIDPKGDLGNLLLTFPNLESSDFKDWVDPVEATRRGMTVEQLAQDAASTWRKGLAESDQPPERIQKFRDATDLAIYTPGGTAGLSLTVLKSFKAPDQSVKDDSDLFRERVGGAVSGLLALLGISGDVIRSREHILLSTILERAWNDGRDVDMPTLIREIQAPPFTTIGVMDIESIFPAPDRFKLSMALNNLLASPGFSAWLEGEELDVARLLHTPEGKPRISILSIAHLSDAERMFFVTILLNEVLAWMRSQSGTSSLRAILYMDEVFGFFPPVANPPSKSPMLTLLKQARAFGLGVMLATQNPADLDYKGLQNAGTWLIGRLQTERDKMRVLDGLEGASVASGSSFDRAQMDRILSALGKRVFLLSNAHEDKPVIFQSRFVMSYLRGPLTRQQ